MTKKTETPEAGYELPVVWNSLNAKFRPKNRKIITQASLTIPDQALSIREIMRRHLQGLPMDDIAMKPIYEDPRWESKGIDPRTLDFVDLQRLRLENNEEIELLRKRAAEEIQDRKDKIEAERLKKENEAAEALWRRAVEQQRKDENK